MPRSVPTASPERMVRLDRILVPLVDGGHALVVLEQALAFASRRKCRVTALAVGAERQPGVGFATGCAPIRRRAASLLAEALLLAERYRFDLDCLYREGDLPVVVDRTVREIGADLIILGVASGMDVESGTDAHVLMVPQGMPAAGIARLLAATSVGSRDDGIVPLPGHHAAHHAGQEADGARPLPVGRAHQNVPPVSPGQCVADCAARLREMGMRVRRHMGRDLYSLMIDETVEETLFAKARPLLAILGRRRKRTVPVKTGGPVPARRTRRA